MLKKNQITKKRTISAKLSWVDFAYLCVGSEFLTHIRNAKFPIMESKRGQNQFGLAFYCNFELWGVDFDSFYCQILDECVLRTASGVWASELNSGLLEPGRN